MDLVAVNLLLEHSSRVQIYTKVTGEGTHYFSFFFSLSLLLLNTSFIFLAFCCYSILFGNFSRRLKSKTTQKVDTFSVYNCLLFTGTSYLFFFICHALWLPEIMIILIMIIMSLIMIMINYDACNDIGGGGSGGRMLFSKSK